jgi:hypothetical protein
MQSARTVNPGSGSRGFSLFGGCRCGGRRRAGPRHGCPSITPDVPVKTPDLATYSQLEELRNGRLPTWNSPDINTNTLRPVALLREARLKLRNLSMEVPALDALVSYSISKYGIGMRRELKLTKRVSLGPSAEIELSFPFDQSTLTGDPRVGVHFEIEHPFDRSRINNIGEQIVDVRYTSEMGRAFSLEIPVFNDSTAARELRLSTLPNDIQAAITPASSVFAPFEQRPATLRLEVPGFLAGTPDATSFREVTVVARLDTQELVGGLTIVLGIDNS